MATKQEIIDRLSQCGGLSYQDWIKLLDSIYFDGDITDVFIDINSNVLPQPEIKFGITPFLNSGTYTYNSQSFTIPEGHYGYFKWDGSSWSLKDMGALPTAIVDKTNTISEPTQKVTTEEAVLNYSLSKRQGEISIDIFKQGYVPALAFTDTMGFGIPNTPYSGGFGIKIPANTASGSRSVYAINLWNENISELNGKTVEFSFIVEHSADYTGAITGTLRTNLTPSGFADVPMTVEVISPTRKRIKANRVFVGTESSIRGFWTVPNFTNASEITFKTVIAEYRVLTDDKGKSANTIAVEEIVKANIPDTSNFATNTSVDNKISIAIQAQNASISDKQIKQSTFEQGFLPTRGFTDVNGIIISNQPYSDGDAIRILSGNATGTPVIYALQQFSDDFTYKVGSKIIFSYIVEHPAIWEDVEMQANFRYFTAPTVWVDKSPVRITKLSPTRRLVEFEHIWLGTETRIQVYWGIKTSVTATQELVFKTVSSDYYIASDTQTSNTLMVKEIVKAEVENANKGVNTTIIKVKRNGTLGEFDFVGNRAIQDAIESINNASETNRYRIEVYDGIYEALVVSDYDAVGAGVNNKCFIRGKDHVDVVGVGSHRVMIVGFLPSNLGTSFQYNYYQTIYWNCDDAILSGVTVTGKNNRYPIHIDGGTTGLTDFSQKLQDVRVIQYGNEGDSSVVWPGSTPVGVGMSQGQELTYDNVELVSKAVGFYFHTNLEFNKPSINILRNSRLVVPDYCAVRVYSNGSQQNDKLIMEGNAFDGCYRIDYLDAWQNIDKLDKLSFNHSEIAISGHGNSPFQFHIDMKGFALKITSKSTGTSSSVRFNPNTSGFQAIIKDKDYGGGSFVDKLGVTNNDGYAYRDGGGELSGYAIGRLDIGSDISGAKYIKSLGKRLGDCSTVNKTLEITIDGTLYTITFDKNYNGTTESAQSNYTNAQIISEINAVIGSVAIASEYSAGNDYFPEVSDVLATVTNAHTDQAILRGMAVVYENNKVRKALQTDKNIFGIALDDFLPNGVGRVQRNGFIWTVPSWRYFALQETYGAIAMGDELGISATAGMLSKTATNKLFRAIRDNVIGFNLD